MLRKFYAVFFFVFLPLSANAISTVSIANTNCSGELTSSTLDGASFACSGNFTLDGGSVTSDSLINISASGDLFLDNLIFTAPNVTFSVLTGMMTIGTSVVINSSSIAFTPNSGAVIVLGTVNVQAGGKLELSQDPNLVINPGANINLGSGATIAVSTPVSEPSTYAMMLAGVLGLASVRRKTI